MFGYDFTAMYSEQSRIGLGDAYVNKNTRNKGHKLECLKLSALTINITDKRDLHVSRDTMVDTVTMPQLTNQ
jgi:hypothetical protein